MKWKIKLRKSFVIILGIDPGYALLGYGIIEKTAGGIRVIDYGVIETHKDTSFPDRLLKIGDAVSMLIRQYNIDSVAIEKLFFNTNVTTAICVAEARGVVIYMARSLNADIYEYTPLQIKQALTGYGKAEKQQVQQMVKSLLGLKTVPKPDDTADALAVALCHIQTGRFTDSFKM